MKPVQFSPLASLEVEATARDYETQVPGLGERFIADVEAATVQVSAFPESAPAFGRHLRRRLLSRFPFTLLYSVCDDWIWVVALMHQRRGPIFIARRLTGRLAPEGTPPRGGSSE